MAVGGGGVEALFYHGPITAGDFAAWESPGVLIDGGTGTTGGVGWTLPAPASSGSPGTAGQISYDALGFFYLCYATNAWARFTGELIWPNVGTTALQFNVSANSQYVPILVGFA